MVPDRDEREDNRMGLQLRDEGKGHHAVHGESGRWPIFAGVQEPLRAREGRLQMTYRDMTFCGRNDCAKFNECFRALNPEVIEKADQAELPISCANFEECYVPSVDKREK